MEEALVTMALPLLMAVFVVAFVVLTIAARKRAGRWREPMPSAARHAAGIAGVVWILAAFGLGFLGMASFAGALIGYPELWIYALASVIASLGSFLLGQLLFAPSRRVLVWSILWAALWTTIIAIVIAGSEADMGALALEIVAPIVAGLLSLLAWMRVAQEH